MKSLRDATCAGFRDSAVFATLPEIGTDCRQAAAPEKTTVMETPMDPAAAISEADDPGRVQGVYIPSALRSRLLRLGDPISPAAVVEKALRWRRCAECRDDGFIGSSLAKTLDFCRCVAGEERRHREGADGAAREIARVHSSLKNTLVAARASAASNSLRVLSR
jgi:hypothetical protein